MTRFIKLLACVLLMAVVLWACAGGVHDETETTAATETTETTQEHTTWPPRYPA